MGATVAWALFTGAVAAAPYPVVDLAPGPVDGGLDSLRAAGAAVVFRRGGTDLWVSDGTAAGTQPLHVGPVDNLTAHDGGIAFTAPSATVPLEDLWLSDATAAGTRLVATISGAGGCPIFGNCAGAAPDVDQLTSVGHHLYFRQNGFALWRSDGSAQGTVKLIDYSRQVCSTACFCCFSIGPDIGPLAHVNDRLVGAVSNGFTGENLLLQSDGADLTSRAIGASISALQGVAGRIFYVASGTLAVANVLGSETVGILPTSNVSSLVAVGSQLFFVIDRDLPTAALWRSDGSAAGTGRVLAGNAADLTAVGARLYFRRRDPAGDTLWISDGTAAGTREVAPLAPSGLTAVGDTLYFAASDDAGAELWQSDGTAAGTTRVADLVPGPDGAAPADLTAACGRLFFTATTPATGRELWALDVDPGACDPDPARCATDSDCTDFSPCSRDLCDAATGCQWSFYACCRDAQCADTDPCTVNHCTPEIGCSFALLPGLEAVRCTLGTSGSEATACPGESIPLRLSRPLDHVRTRVARAADDASPARALRGVNAAIRGLDRLVARLDRAAALGMITPTCRTALGALTQRARDRAEHWAMTQ